MIYDCSIAVRMNMKIFKIVFRPFMKFVLEIVA